MKVKRDKELQEDADQQKRYRRSRSSRTKGTGTLVRPAVVDLEMRVSVQSSQLCPDHRCVIVVVAASLDA